MKTAARGRCAEMDSLCASTDPFGSKGREIGLRLAAGYDTPEEAATRYQARKTGLYCKEIPAHAGLLARGGCA